MTASLPGFLAFGALSVMLLLGVFLRARIKFLQNAMIPASLIGGLIGFILVSLGWVKFFSPEFKWVTITSADFLPFTFHAFNISFISLCLTRSDNSASTSEVVKGGMWLSLGWSASLTLQALIGGLVVLIYNLIVGTDLSVFMGYLVTHGFTQGPGQGFAMGQAWESMGITDAATLGLIWAAFGFIAAYVIGVPYARSFVKKGLNINKRSKIDEEFLTGLLKKDNQIEGGKETTHSSSIETLAYHAALIGLVYVLTYALITGVRYYVNIQLFQMLYNYPLFFLHGLIIALIIRKVMDKTGIGHLTDPGMQKRITGLSVDYLLVASVMGISVAVLSKYLGVIILGTLVVTLVTFLMVRIFASRLTELGPERAVSAFGCCCGSTASGLLLLRILDADYSSGVGLELAFFNVAIVFTTMPIMLVAFTLPTLAHSTIIMIYLANTLVCFAGMWFLARWNPAKKAAA